MVKKFSYKLDLLNIMKGKVKKMDRSQNTSRTGNNSRKQCLKYTVEHGKWNKCG